MKTNCFFLSIFIFFLTMHIANAQEYKEKSYFDSNKKLGKDVVIKQSIIKIEDTKTYKIFEIESPDNGNYYLNAWMNGAELENFGSGKYLEYELTVNNEKQAEKIKPLKSNWHKVISKN